MDEQAEPPECAHGDGRSEPGAEDDAVLWHGRHVAESEGDGLDDRMQVDIVTVTKAMTWTMAMAMTRPSV